MIIYLYGVLCVFAVIALNLAQSPACFLITLCHVNNNIQILMKDTLSTQFIRYT